METMEKLKILTMAAKYDVACTSSGVGRQGQPGGLGSAEACGICHSFASDGRCISLLKVLMTNYCVFDCQYCPNRRSADVPRTAFSPEELAELAMSFYKRNYIEGVFLSSAVIRNPDYTMELLIRTLTLIRKTYRFNGYIHVKAIPGADPRLIQQAGFMADRMSANIELPSSQSLSLLAPDKSREAVLAPMRLLKNGIAQSKNEMVIYRHTPPFVPAGQSTQLIVGATQESDGKIVRLSESLYGTYSLKRVFYSAFMPVANQNKLLPDRKAPLLREHRLYQADWLLRFYGFKADEIIDEEKNLSLNMDPKCRWAIDHLNMFPVEVNKADYMTLLRVPGIGVGSARKIISARRTAKLDFPLLKKMGIVLKRAKYFITCEGRMYEKVPMYSDILETRLTENKIDEAYDQLNIFDQGLRLLPPPLVEAERLLEGSTGEDGVKCLTGEI